MERFFNTAGPCEPRSHYMLPWEDRLPNVRDLIDRELYFVIHAPRQVGKTTSFRQLARELTESGQYAAMVSSCEQGQNLQDDVDAGVTATVEAMWSSARVNLPEELRPPRWDIHSVGPQHRLREMLQRWTIACPRPLVLFLDEIDALLDSTLLSVLRQLRAGYSDRPEGFPHSTALIGLRDVRDYKLKLRPDAKSMGTASPFNVKVESMTLRNFTHEEVGRLYRQHTDETGQEFSDEAVERAFELSQGHPWLVNALAYQICFRTLKDRSQQVTVEHIDEAKEVLIERRDTHLDSLVDKLREPEVQQVIEPILTGSTSFDQTFNDNFSYVKDLGLVTIRDGVRQIANPIYQEIIPRVLTFQIQTGIPLTPKWFVASDGTLDMAKLLDGFLEFWRRHGEVLLAGMPYHEAAPHLVLMAYLQRVVNSGGRIEREFAVGTGRADLVTEMGGRQDIIELKLQRGTYTLTDGLEQVARYATRLGRDRGYLLIFDTKTDKPWEERGEVEEVEHEGVTVIVVRA